jgi:hypothetical protein
VSSVAILIACALLAVFGGRIGTTFALFNAETENVNSAFTNGWLDPPTIGTVTAAGNNVTITSTPGTHGPGSGEGQAIYAVDNGTSANCVTATYPTTITGTATVTSTYTDAGGTTTGTGTGRGTTANAGDYYCYKIAATAGTAWLSLQSSGLGTQVGLFANALAFANHGTTGRIDKTDTIKINFNQATNLPTTATTLKVCVKAGTAGAGVIYLGDPATTCGTGDSATLATITGLTIGTTLTMNTSTVVAITTSPYTATITLNQAGTTNSTVSGTGKVAPTAATTTKSSATANQATLCQRATTACQPTAATAF